MKHHAPTTVVLYRARLIFTLTALIPTVLMTALGIIFVAEGGSKSMAVVGGRLSGTVARHFDAERVRRRNVQGDLLAGENALRPAVPVEHRSTASG